MSKRRLERRHVLGDSNFTSSSQSRPPAPIRPGTSLGFTPLPRGVYASNCVESSLSDGTSCGTRMPFSSQLEKMLHEDDPHEASHLKQSSGLSRFRPEPRPDTAPEIRFTGSGFLAKIPTSDSLRDGAEPVPESKYPWRDPRKATTQSTGWVDTIGNTTIRPPDRSSETLQNKKQNSQQETHFYTTFRGKEPGGFMFSHPSSEGDKIRPATSLGFTETKGATRPSFSEVAGITKPPTPTPVTEDDLVALRRTIYQKAVSVRRAFRKADPSGNALLTSAKFCSVLENIGLDLDQGMIQRVVAFLDPKKTGQVNYNKFVNALNLKESEGEYNPFLLERTYFGGAANIDSAPKEKRAFSGEEIKAAYLLKENIAKAFDLKYAKASEMFRSVDENSDGALSPEEFVDKIRRFNLRATPEQVKNMMAVLHFPKLGLITYDDFVNHIKLPDKWGFCSAFNYYLPLGQSGEKPTPLDSTVLENTTWKRQGRKVPSELMKMKKQTLKDMVEEGKEIWENKPVATMVIPGKVREGHLDIFLLEAVRNKLKTMRKSTRGMFRLLDPRCEGRISRDNFHSWVQKEQLGIPRAAVDELIDYFDQDHAGYIEMQEFASVIDPDGNVLPPLPDHEERDRQEQDQYLKGAAHPLDPPRHELHPEAIHCLETGQVSPLLLDLVQQAIQRQSKSIRHMFRKWDTDHDGFVSVHELREGMARMNLGITQSVAARLAVATDQDGNRKLDFNEFVRAFKPADKSGARATQQREVMNDDLGTFSQFLGRNQEANTVHNPDRATMGSVKSSSDSIPAGLVNTRTGIRSRMGAYDGSASQSVVSSPSPDLFTSKGELLFYNQADSKPRCKVPAGESWNSRPREGLRESWEARTAAKRHIVTSVTTELLKS